MQTCGQPGAECRQHGRDARVTITSLSVIVLALLFAIDMCAEGVGAIPDALRKEWGLSPFYEQCLDADGLPIVASARVSPFALLEARYLIDHMLADRQDSGEQARRLNDLTSV